METLVEGRDLVDEVLSRNTVRVAKFEARSLRGLMRKIQVSEEIVATRVGGSAALLHADHIRVLSGRKPIYWNEWIRRLGGQPLGFAPNLRTNDGADFTYNQLSGTSVAIADTLAISNNTLAVTVTDHASSTLPWSTAQAVDAAAGTGTGEWSANGLARKVATTNSHSGSATTYTLAATWTATGTQTGTSKIGLLGGTGKATIASGTLVLANTFTATTLASGDALTVTWTITI